MGGPSLLVSSRSRVPARLPCTAAAPCRPPSPVPRPCPSCKPQAFRQWGVELHDWQSQCSVKADGAGVDATTRRMMPTVGCEADAIAFTSDARRLLESDPSSTSAPPTIASDGAYSAGPSDVSAADTAAAAFEACLVLAPRERRVRVVHNLARRGAAGDWRLDDVEVHNERYDGPQTGRVELTGCGGGMSPFATGARLAPDALAGAWTAAGVRYTCGAGAGCSAEAVADEAWSAEGLPSVLLHPLSTWSSCAVSGEGGNDISVAVGVLLEGGDSMAVVTRRMQGGRLAAVELLTLTRAS